MQGQRGQDFETAARGRHSFRFLGPRPNDRLSHPVKEAAYRAAIHLNPQRGVERLAHFLQAALGIALMRAPQERLRLGGEFATISLTPPVQETGEALGRQAGLVTKILWPTKGHRVSAEKLVHGQIGSSDLFYHRCDLLGSAFPAGRGPVHPPQHSLNMAIWPACSAVFVRSWGIKRDRKSTRLNSSHGYISYAVFCLKKKKQGRTRSSQTRPRASWTARPPSSS